jgi:hypothetical protein
VNTLAAAALAAASLVAALALPLRARAAGGHDAVGCTGCHSLHGSRGALIFALAPNRKMVNPRTGEPYESSSALCLACHAEPAQGGQGIAPVSQHLSHPVSLAAVNPRLARVPDELLRGGRFECVACHDPHPSNPNYRYLRVNVGSKAPTIAGFCGVCHPRQADPSARKARLFSSMDERAAAAPAPAKAR